MDSLAPYETNLARQTDRLAELLKQTAHRLSGVLKSWPMEAQLPGVYAISLEDDQIVYIGMTVKQVLANRFHDHFHLKGTSDLRGMLPHFEHFSPTGTGRIFCAVATYSNFARPEAV